MVNGGDLFVCMVAGLAMPLAMLDGYKALLGAALLEIVDVAARFVVRPAELPVGILTALVGAPAEHAAVADYLCGSDDAARVQRALATPLGPIAFDPAAASRVRAFTLPATGAMP